MKYLIGFIGGVVFTLVVFVFMQKKEQADLVTSETAIAETVAAEAGEEDTSVPPDFFQFYTQFHDDSTYQVTHIQFPLQGLPPNVDSITLAKGNFRWQAADWVIHKSFDSMNGEFHQFFDAFGKEMVVERIQHQSGKYGMQRRFAKFEDGWKLIFYAGMNELKAEE